jgi:hypothetical protein
MSDFDPSSSILSGTRVDVTGVLTAFGDLPGLYTEAIHTSAISNSRGTTGFDTVGGSTCTITAVADELVIAYSQMNISMGSTSGIEWQLRHNISGETLSVSKRVKYLGGTSDTTGKRDTLSWITVFQNLTGSKSILAEWGNLDTAPSGTVYSHVGYTCVFQLKKRSS